jgi:hypothetical protein
MDATYKSEEPFLGPNSFAGIVLRTEWFIVEVGRERGMVCETPPFHCDGFLGGCDDHVEIIVQSFLSVTVMSVSIKGRIKKGSNGSRDPIKKVVSAGKEKRVGWVKVEPKEFLACKLNAGLNLPHMGYMENVEDLLRMLRMEWCP